MKYTTKQFDAWKDELFDRTRVIPMCKQHMYTGDEGQPTHQCEDCWFVFFLLEVGKAPPHLRYERLMQLYENIRRQAELEERGLLDMRLFRLPKIHVEHIPD